MVVVEQRTDRGRSLLSIRTCSKRGSWTSYTYQHVDITFVIVHNNLTYFLFARNGYLNQFARVRCMSIISLYYYFTTRLSLAAIRTRDEGVFMITLLRLFSTKKVSVNTAASRMITYGREANVAMIMLNGHYFH